MNISKINKPINGPEIFHKKAPATSSFPNNPEYLHACAL